MLQLSQALGIEKEILTHLVQNNLDNQHLVELVVEEGLGLMELELRRVEDVQFFIRHVFKIVREAREKELIVLKEFMTVSEDENLRKLADMLISQNQGPQTDLNSILDAINEALLKNNPQQIQSILNCNTCKDYQQCLQFLMILIDPAQRQHWDSKDYRNKLQRSAAQAFKNISQRKVQEELYLQMIAVFMIKIIRKEQHTVYLAVIFNKLVEQHQRSVLIVIKYLNQKSRKEGMPNCILSRAVFKMFTSVFEHQIYFDQNAQQHLEPVVKLAHSLFKTFSDSAGVTQLGWVSIFSLDRLTVNKTFQKDLHICSSILRQIWYFKPVLISECLCFVISSYIQKSSIADIIDKLQSILTILTPKELMYLLLKLEGVLSDDKKRQIVQQGSTKSGIVKVCVNHFLIKFGPMGDQNMFKDMKQILQDQHADIDRQIQMSRYNSYEKQVDYFLRSAYFNISCRVSESKLVFRSNLVARIRFFANLLKQDYFGEQFWMNEQKMQIFGNVSDSDTQKIQTVSQFLKQSKIINLSGIMLLTQIMKATNIQLYSENLSTLLMKTVNSFNGLCRETLQQDVFVSNVVIVLKMLVQVVKISHSQSFIAQMVELFNRQNLREFMGVQEYNFIHYALQFITLSHLISNKQQQQLGKYRENLKFYNSLISQNKSIVRPNQYTQKIANFYFSNPSQYIKSLSCQNITQKWKIKNIISNGVEVGSLKNQIIEMFGQFKLQSPTFKGQIIYFTYLAHSSEDNYFFNNHFLSFLKLEYIRIIAKTAQKTGDKRLSQQIFDTVVVLLQKVKSGDTFSHSDNFYKSLVQSQIVYNLCSNPNISSFDLPKLNTILDLCLTIIQKENYPLLRQHIETVLCRVYLAINTKDPNNQRRKQLIQMLKVSVNIGVPIVLTLGYQLISCSRHPQKYKKSAVEISELHQLLIKFISIHTAYMRAICQYYLSLYLELVPPSDPFLINISKYWKQDRDSQKILKNVALVVEGFRQAVENQVDFLGFERVEQYPSNRVKLQFYRSAVLFYTQEMTEQQAKGQQQSYLFQAYTASIEERCEELKKKYLNYFDIFSRSPNERKMKGNTRKKAQQVKKDDKVQKKGKKKQIKMNKNVFIQKVELPQHSYLNVIQKRLEVSQQLQSLSAWYRSNVNPTVIVIATLLQKVHNFGHILRTLNGHNAMLVVPSDVPLQNQECKELIPPDCDVQIIDIRQRDLQSFIVVMKSLGYPMVALEQCSKSVQVNQAKFPNKFMLLLGNQRLGAPSWLLNEGDLLVQIPQIGKIRSLNVHVSMVLCLWQYLSKKH